MNNTIVIAIALIALIFVVLFVALLRQPRAKDIAAKPTAPEIEAKPEPAPKPAPKPKAAPAPKVEAKAPPKPSPKPAPKAAAKPKPVAKAPAKAPAKPKKPAAKGVVAGGTAAVSDVAGQMLDLKSTGGADDLTKIKGLGPKAAALLADQGIAGYDQLGKLDEMQIAAIDDKMGAFKGRIIRDRWVEQARYLARGDIASFEAEFGKLG